MFPSKAHKQTPPQKYQMRRIRFAVNPLGNSRGTVIESRLLLRYGTYSGTRILEYQVNVKGLLLNNIYPLQKYLGWIIIEIFV